MGNDDITCFDVLEPFLDGDIFHNGSAISQH
jgi:hypothetical protein